MPTNTKEYNRDYYLKHIQYYRDKTKKWMWTHKTRVSEYHKQRKLTVLIHYGGNPPRCACCGESHIEFLTIDHIKGNGAEHRKQLSGDSRKCSGSRFRQWLIDNNFPKGFQVMCCNCNMAKGRSKVQFCPVHHPELYPNNDIPFRKPYKEENELPSNERNTP